jgi:hypothetical protein
MEVVWHYDVSEQKKAARSSRFINRAAGNHLDGVSPKDWRAIVAYCSYEQTWIVL